MDIFNFDDEQNILNYLTVHLEQTLLLNGNSFERKLLCCVQNIDSFSPNNGHRDLPPDYYSDELSIMFDVLRVNDTEVKKTYNPLKIEERKMRNMAKEQGLLDLPNTTPVIEVDEPDDVNAHTYQKYCKQAHRTIAEHIRKIPLWVKEHPFIKHKGLLIFDETEFCFEGFITSVGNGQFLYRYKSPLVMHEAWNDANFFKQIYESDLDFVIWFCPYKPYGKIPMKHEDYGEEYKIAREEHSCALFGYEDMECGKLSLYGDEISGLTVYRGRMMKPEMYKDFYNKLWDKGIILVNSPEEYDWCYMLPGRYQEFKDDMPEYRVLVFAGNITLIDDYWESRTEGKITETEVSWIREKAKSIRSNFVTMDIARHENGKLIIREIGDGQVSDLQQIDAEKFYRQFNPKL